MLHRSKRRGKGTSGKEEEGAAGSRASATAVQRRMGLEGRAPGREMTTEEAGGGVPVAAPPPPPPEEEEQVLEGRRLHAPVARAGDGHRRRRWGLGWAVRLFAAGSRDRGGGCVVY